MISLLPREWSFEELSLSRKPRGPESYSPTLLLPTCQVIYFILFLQLATPGVQVGAQDSSNATTSANSTAVTKHIHYSPVFNSTTGSITAAAGALILIGSLVTCWLCKERILPQALKRRSPWLSRHLGRHIRLKKILEATDNFSPHNLLGIGESGKVYWGVGLGGEQWVVKRTECSSDRSITNFRAEVNTISKVHHKNLVELLGFCQESHNCILVYEKVANGTLYQHLHLEAGLSGRPLSFAQRLEIALGAARGLQYLHSFAREPIIHGNFKSANILLSENFEAKVSDFGLSKLLPWRANQEQPSTYFAGTPGYLDPSYYSTMRLDARSDVFSFGVVLLELLTGKPAVVDDPLTVDGQMSLARWVATHVKAGAVEAAMDPKLGEDYDVVAAEAMILLGKLCTQRSPELRPTMDVVTRRLEEIQGMVVSPDNMGFRYQMQGDESV
eukprot:jgi/Mesen1/8066/ME000432S07347